MNALQRLPPCANNSSEDRSRSLLLLDEDRPTRFLSRAAHLRIGVTAIHLLQGIQRIRIAQLGQFTDRLQTHVAASILKPPYMVVDEFLDMRHDQPPRAAKALCRLYSHDAAAQRKSALSLTFERSV